MCNFFLIKLESNSVQESFWHTFDQNPFSGYWDTVNFVFSAILATADSDHLEMPNCKKKKSKWLHARIILTQSWYDSIEIHFVSHFAILSNGSYLDWSKFIYFWHNSMQESFWHKLGQNPLSGNEDIGMHEDILSNGSYLDWSKFIYFWHNSMQESFWHKLGQNPPSGNEDIGMRHQIQCNTMQSCNIFSNTVCLDSYLDWSKFIYFWHNSMQESFWHKLGQNPPSGNEDIGMRHQLQCNTMQSCNIFSNTVCLDKVRVSLIRCVIRCLQRCMQIRLIGWSAFAMYNLLTASAWTVWLLLATMFVYSPGKLRLLWLYCAAWYKYARITSHWTLVSSFFLNWEATWIDGWMTCNFMFFLTVFQSNQDDGWVIMEGWVQWNPIYDWNSPASSESRTQDRQISRTALNLLSYREEATRRQWQCFTSEWAYNDETVFTSVTQRQPTRQRTTHATGINKQS